MTAPKPDSARAKAEAREKEKALRWRDDLVRASVTSARHILPHAPLRVVALTLTPAVEVLDLAAAPSVQAVFAALEEIAYDTDAGHCVGWLRDGFEAVAKAGNVPLVIRHRAVERSKALSAHLCARAERETCGGD